ncbi:MAG: hypothetical protein MUO82_11260 [Candidatus Thermoplasmatota archaeon]|nr:hypothetical protein [Candidatus Thermoplasmatota archaeon]
MNKKIISLLVLGVMLLSSIVQISATSIIKESYDIEEKGVFKAELGKKGDEKSTVSLSGMYSFKEKIILVNGNATLGEKEGSFKGVFKGNHFYLTIPIKGHVLIIIGKINFDKDNNTFKGFWIGKGLPIKGWITGSFSQT